MGLTPWVDQGLALTLGVERAATGCHRACAVGCIRPNDITACTTRYYGGRYRDCGRCVDGYRSLNNQQYLGCTPGKKTDTSCVTKPPAPTCVDPTIVLPCSPDRRRRLAVVDEARASESTPTLTGGNSEAAGLGAPARQLQDLEDFDVQCSCDGTQVFGIDPENANCVWTNPCTCTPGAVVPFFATCLLV